MVSLFVIMPLSLLVLYLVLPLFCVSDPQTVGEPGIVSKPCEFCGAIKVAPSQVAASMVHWESDNAPSSQRVTPRHSLIPGTLRRRFARDKRAKE